MARFHGHLYLWDPWFLIWGLPSYQQAAAEQHWIRVLALFGGTLQLPE